MEKVKKQNQILEKCYAFSVRIVKFSRAFPKESAGYVLSKQLVASGTSIIANIEEAQGAFSKDDFIYKMQTAFKEALETNLWLRISMDSGLVQNEECKYLIQESRGIKYILGRIVKTSKQRKV